MYALVFLTRYPDVLSRFISLYNTIMKIFYIVSAFYVLSLRWIYPRSPESRMARQATAIILISAALISLVFNYSFTVYEVR
jgi:ER lumen protein retaining receptor